jgi:hypothetical protein
MQALLHPRLTAAATFVGGFAAAIAGAPAVAAAMFHLPQPFVTLFGDRIGPMIPAAASVVAIICTYVAGAGRSFIRAVDSPNSGPQKP